jgi:hypothetical protein
VIEELTQALAKRDAETALEKDEAKKTKPNESTPPPKKKPEMVYSPVYETMIKKKNAELTIADFGKWIEKFGDVFRIGNTSFKVFNSLKWRNAYVLILRSAFYTNPKYEKFLEGGIFKKNPDTEKPYFQELLNDYPVPNDNMGFYLNDLEDAANKVKNFHATDPKLKPSSDRQCIIKATPKPDIPMAKTGGLFTFGAPPLE